MVAIKTEEESLATEAVSGRGGSLVVQGLVSGEYELQFYQPNYKPIQFKVENTDPGFKRFGKVYIQTKGK